MFAKIVCFIFFLICGTVSDSYSDFPELVSFYRYFKTKGLGGDTLYTTNWTEYGFGSYGYTYKYEAIECNVYDKPLTETKPLYRFFSSENGDHFYSTNFNFESELHTGTPEYEFELIAAYVYSEPKTGTVPLWQYVRFNHRDHIYTPDWNKYGKGNASFRNQGVVAYVYATNVSRDPSADIPEQVPIYEYYMNEGVGGNHMYSSNRTAQDSIRFHDYYYTNQGILCSLYDRPVSGTTPLFRFYNEFDRNSYYSTDLHWRTSQSRKKYSELEGIEGYLFPEPRTGTVPLWQYLLVNNKDNVYTVDWNRYGKGNKDVLNQGIVGYVFP